MTQHIEAADRQEVTVSFLPHRLNRQPVIVRGLTASELWVTVAVSAVVGIFVGTLVAIVTGSFPMAPTTVGASIAIGVFLGGGALKRHKRGRPDTWLYRRAQWSVVHRVPFIAKYLGASDLIVRDGYWSTHRGLRA